MVQANGRFVEHVKNAAQLGSDLRGEADALAFSARERGSRAAERQVAQSDVVQELQAFGDFVHDATGNGQFPARQFDLARGIEGAGNRKTREIGDRHAVHFHSQAFRTQTLAVAHRTFGGRHEIEQVLAIGIGSGGFEILFEVAENPEKSCLPFALAFTLRLAVEQQVLNLVGKFLKGRRQVETVGLHNQLDAANQVLRCRPRSQAAIEYRLRPIDNYFGRIEIVAAFEAVAFGTGSIGTVERERSRLQLRNADAAIRAR